MTTGQYQGTGAGVTPKDTAEERINRSVQGESNFGTTPGGTGPTNQFGTNTGTTGTRGF
jgi:hypothetical protein